jgi:hypothetical protein
MCDAFERTVPQLGDEEVALGIAQRLLHAIVGETRCQLSIIAIKRGVPNEELAIAAFCVRRVRQTGIDSLDIGRTGLTRNGRVSGRSGNGKNANQGNAQDK